MCGLFHNNEDKYSYFSSMRVQWQDLWKNLSVIHHTNFVEGILKFSIIHNTEIRFVTYFSVFPKDFWIQNVNVKISSDLVTQKSL